MEMQFSCSQDLNEYRKETYIDHNEKSVFCLQVIHRNDNSHLKGINEKINFVFYSRWAILDTVILRGVAIILSDVPNILHVRHKFFGVFKC